MRLNSRATVAAATMGLLLTAVPVAAAESAAPTATISDATAAKPDKTTAPTISYSISEDETTIDGKFTQPAGPLNLRVLSIDNDHLLTLFQLRNGYAIKDLRRDSKALSRLYAEGGKKNAAAFRRMEKNVVGLGGATASEGSLATATVNLKPGTYYLSDNAGPPLGHLRKLTVVATPKHASAPKHDATITMTKDLAFGGAKNLPATGTIRIKNVVPGGYRWLQPTLLQVVQGTTAKQVADLYGGRGDGSFVLAGYVGGDTLSPGKDQYLTYSVEPGTYALLCFFPNPDNPGSTYVADGMVRIVHLN
jgi:hypothetical protein